MSAAGEMLPSNHQKSLSSQSGTEQEKGSKERERGKEKRGGKEKRERERECHARTKDRNNAKGE